MEVRKKLTEVERLKKELSHLRWRRSQFDEIGNQKETDDIRLAIIIKRTELRAKEGYSGGTFTNSTYGGTVTLAGDGLRADVDTSSVSTLSSSIGADAYSGMWSTAVTNTPTYDGTYRWDSSGSDYVQCAPSIDGRMTCTATLSDGSTVRLTGDEAREIALGIERDGLAGATYNGLRVTSVYMGER